MSWHTIYSFVSELGTKYGVNPIIFSVIYIGAIPFFTLSVGWLVHNVRKKKSIVVPLLSTSFFYISAYLYLIIAGKNVPLWVYGFIVFMVVAGAYFAIRKVKAQLHSQKQD